MKKILLFIILALSINAKAQNLHPKSNIQYATSGSIAYVLKKLNVNEGKSASHFPEKNFGGTIKHQTAILLPSIQVIDSIIIWQWDPDTLIMDWKYYLKEIDILYDANNNGTSVTLQFWNDSTWQTLAKIDFTYDDHNNQTSALYQGWNGFAWVNIELENFTYDANDNQTHYLDQNWNVNAWENNVQSLNTYDANNNEIKEIHQNWNVNAWENDIQFLYTHNIQNLLTREIFQTWNGSSWGNLSQFIYTYDADNNLIGEVSQDWDSNWVNSGNYTFTYDVNHNRTSSTYQSWDGSAWVNVSSSTFTYDANNDLISGLDLFWTGSAWEYSSQDIYTYTYVDGFLESNSSRSFDETGTYEGDSTHYYFHTVTGINDLAREDGDITIYPNPTSGRFTISSHSTLSDIEIYNFLGERIYSDSKIKNETAIDIDLSTFGKGLYFINMYDGTKVHNKKIVVQ